MLSSNKRVQFEMKENVYINDEDEFTLASPS
jgi:hypothetical protein